MTVEQMTVLVKALAVILGLIYAVIIKPAIETYVSKDVIEEYLGYIKIAIRCAEQIFTPEEWAEKKEYVYSYAIGKAKELGVELSAEDINILVEGFVNEIKKG